MICFCGPPLGKLELPDSQSVKSFWASLVKEATKFFLFVVHLILARFLVGKAAVELFNECKAGLQVSTKRIFIVKKAP